MLEGKTTARRAIVATALAFAFGVTALTTGFLVLSRIDAARDAEAASRDLASMLAEHAARTFDVSDLVAAGILEHLARRGGVAALEDDYATFRFLAGMVTKLPLSGIISVFDARGRLLVASDRHPAPDIDAADRSWFRVHAVDGLERHVGEAVVGRATGEILFTYTRRIADAEGGFAGVLVLALRPAFFNDALFEGYFGGDTAMAIFGVDGRIVARRPFNRGMIGTTATTERLFSEPRFAGAPEGTYWTASRIDGRERVVSFLRLGNWPVIVAAGLGSRDVFARWWFTAYWCIGVGTVILAGVVGLAWLGLRAAAREQRARDALERALADKNVLFREVHHRVKNNLQMTMSLLQRQQRRFRDPVVADAFAETQRQLSSISLVHEALYQADSASEVDFADFLRRLLPDLRESCGGAARGIHLSVETGGCTLDLDRAVPLALIVTEVVSNAFKHAFPPGRGGRVSVALDTANGGCALTVRDDGVGMTEDPGDGSTGMKLIRALARQIGADYAFANDRGTVFRLDVPARPANAA